MKNQSLLKAATKFILSFAIVALFLSSCKKDDDADVGDKNYMISFKINDVLEEFPIADEIRGSFYEDVTKTQFGVAFTGDSNSKKIYIDVYDNKMITESPYTVMLLHPLRGKNQFM